MLLSAGPPRGERKQCHARPLHGRISFFQLPRIRCPALSAKMDGTGAGLADEKLAQPMPIIMVSLSHSTSLSRLLQQGRERAFIAIDATRRICLAHMPTMMMPRQE